MVRSMSQLSVDDAFYENDLTENGSTQMLYSEQKSMALMKDPVMKFTKFDGLV